MSFIRSAILLLISIPAATSSGEVVELVLKGSKTVKGELLRENLKGILLKDEPSPGLIRWAQVETVNGRPARERLAQVQQTQKDILCQDCHGGLVTLLCPECLGLGKIYRESKPCGKCAAGDETPCPVKGCEKGKVDCPGACLKRSVGVWKEEKGHGWFRVFINKNDKGGERTSFASEKHLGTILEFQEVAPFSLANCPKCSGIAKSPCKDCRDAGTFILAPYKAVGDCKICGGSYKGRGKVPCTVCLGTGTLLCNDCMGTKMVPVLESMTACSLCKEGIIGCGLCEDTGLYDSKAKRNPVVSAPVLRFRGDLRQALSKIDEANFTVTERVTFRDGRSLQGVIVHHMSGGIMLAIRVAATQDLQILPVFIKQGYRLTPVSSAPSPAANDKKSEPATPLAAPDTVVLKDGTTITGKIVAKSDELLVVQTADGKFVKIGAEKVAEIRTQPKLPKDR